MPHARSARSQLSREACGSRQPRRAAERRGVGAIATSVTVTNGRRLGSASGTGCAPLRCPLRADCRAIVPTGSCDSRPRRWSSVAGWVRRDASIWNLRRTGYCATRCSEVSRSLYGHSSPPKAAKRPIGTAAFQLAALSSAAFLLLQGDGGSRRKDASSSAA